MKTDEEIAKEISLGFVYPESGYNIPNFVRVERKDAFEKGRELEREKALRFAEFLDDYKHNSHDAMYYKKDRYGDIDGEPFSLKKLYSSKAFEDYYNSLKK